MKSFPFLVPRRTKAALVQPGLDQWPDRRQTAARVVYCLLTGLTLALVVISMPAAFARLQTVCRATPCRAGQLTIAQVHELALLGGSPRVFAAYALAWAVLVVVVCSVVSALVMWRAPSAAMGVFVGCVLVTVGAASVPGIRDTLLTATAPVRVAAQAVFFLGRVSPVLLFFVFPDGRFVPHWMRWWAAIAVVLSINAHFFREVGLGPLLATPGGNALALGLIAVAVGGQVYRYLRVSSPAQRHQTRWVVWGIVVAMLLSQGTQVALLVLPPLPVPGLMLAYAILYGSMLLIPLSIAIALLRSHLWDVDPVVMRTLLYVLLTGVVVALYIVVVGTLSLLFQAQGNALLALVATGLIALVVHPLRGWIQRGVNQFLYGARDEPYTVLAQLGQRLEATLAPEAILPTIVATVRETLKLPYVAIAIDQDGSCAMAAAAGSPVADTLTLPLVHHGAPIGMLILGARTPGEPFTPADRRLLADLARQAGTAAHAIRLSTELQRSRERLVLAREEERRRMRNELHDGLAPTLAALALAASTVVEAIPEQPASAVALASDLEQQLRATVGEVRRMVYGLRPPALDELGLVAALQECARQATRYHPSHGEGMDRIAVVVEAPDNLPVLPAAVEVAAYRITQEALHNVIKHAQARTCRVGVSFSGVLQVEISDDGRGVAPDRQPGVGLHSMRERAAELGGTCVIESRVGGGTRVRARIPVATA